jgi:hypothetical protein
MAPKRCADSAERMSLRSCGFDGDTYRAVCTVRYAEAVYVSSLFPEEITTWDR